MTTASIVTHDTPAELLDEVLASLLASSVDRIYVVNNSSPESLPPLPDSPKIVAIQTDNRGFGAGHNIALREVMSASDFHLVVNPDVRWKGDIIKTIVDFMEANPDVGLLSPKTFYPDGRLQYTTRMLPTPLDLFAKRFLPASLTRRRMDRYLLKAHNHDMPLNSPYLLGSFMMFRMEALRQCGLFDERFFMYPEDIDITRRLHRRWRTLYWPGVEIIHDHAAASRHSLRMLWIHLSNMARYFNKYGWLRDPERTLLNSRLLSSLSP